MGWLLNVCVWTWMEMLCIFMYNKEETRGFCNDMVIIMTCRTPGLPSIGISLLTVCIMTIPPPNITSKSLPFLIRREPMHHRHISTCPHFYQPPPWVYFGKGVTVWVWAPYTAESLQVALIYPPPGIHKLMYKSPVTVKRERKLDVLYLRAGVYII